METGLWSGAGSWFNSCNFSSMLSSSKKACVISLAFYYSREYSMTQENIEVNMPLADFILYWTGVVRSMD